MVVVDESDLLGGFASGTALPDFFTRVSQGFLYPRAARQI